MTGILLDVRWGAYSHTGNHREENQDAHLANPPVFVVADGMGGHASGREAAELVVQAFQDTSWGTWVTPQSLKDATATANRLVRELGRQVGGAPGSTLTGVGLAVHDDEPCWLIFNIGDSRTYLMRDDVLEQVTVDHSHHQALVDLGMRSDATPTDRRSNVITQAIGGGLPQAPVLDQWLLPARAGDRILLCSDGLTGEVSDQLIGATLQAAPNPQKAATALVAAAIAGAGRDNITALVVDAGHVSGTPVPADLPGADDTVDESGIELSGDTRPDLEVVP
ncbi:PP2C family protein-serine/threonine phosphatase [Nocardioides pelophilus]|uniref:PP2C family protein-serine/threonine phosphatase n=1 Tax=Nocardioides pelophilus TaxID=2172019 RepID=UPI0016031C87|nr:protein phosphatase 2C domain-containing protein [Nocardioides pelophilus]